MRVQRIAIAAAFAAGLAALPFSQAKAQYYPYPCNPFPLFWPFCAAAAVVGTVGAIVTAPFRGGFYPYYPRYYYGNPAVPYSYPPTGAYYPPGAAYSASPYTQPASVAPGGVVSPSPYPAAPPPH